MIITLCGSARFERDFHLWNKILTLAGHTVFSLAAFPSIEGGKNWYTPVAKGLLDEAHRRKIDASDAIVVINTFAYLGESTLHEIRYARSSGKAVYFTSSWGKHHGVTAAHTKGVKDCARSYGCYGFKSPIDASEGGENGYVMDLLGPAGAMRSAMARWLETESCWHVPADMGPRLLSALAGLGEDVRRDIDSIGVLSSQPGSLVVLRVSSHLSPTTVGEVCNVLRAKTSMEVLAVPASLDVEVLPDEQALLVAIDNAIENGGNPEMMAQLRLFVSTRRAIVQEFVRQERNEAMLRAIQLGDARVPPLVQGVEDALHGMQDVIGPVEARALTGHLQLGDSDAG